MKGGGGGGGLRKERKKVYVQKKVLKVGRMSNGAQLLHFHSNRAAGLEVHDGVALHLSHDMPEMVAQLQLRQEHSGPIYIYIYI